MSVRLDTFFGSNSTSKSLDFYVNSPESVRREKWCLPWHFLNHWARFFRQTGVKHVHWIFWSLAFLVTCNIQLEWLCNCILGQDPCNFWEKFASSSALLDFQNIQSTLKIWSANVRNLSTILSFKFLFLSVFYTILIVVLPPKRTHPRRPAG